MSQVINTNVLSLTAQRNLQTSQSQLATSLQRLSSGLRINSAKDDAAGLAISERFTTQIRGLNQAIRNANDGISLAQTGEAALATVTENLQRIRELAVQSVNATNSATDRATLQQEVAQRRDEIERIASQTSFNGRKVLDGTFGNALFQVGANVGETISLTLDSSVRSASIGEVATATTNAVAGSGNLIVEAADAVASVSNVSGSFSTITLDYVDGSNSDAFSFSVGGVTVLEVDSATGTADATVAAADIDAALAGSTVATNLSNAGISFTGTAVDGNLQFTRADGAALVIAQTITETGTTPATAGSGFAAVSGSTGLVGTFNNGTGAVTGVPLTIAAGDLQIKIGDAEAVSVTGTFATADALLDGINTALGSNASASIANNVISISGGSAITITSDNNSVFTDSSFAATGSLNDLSVTTPENSNVAIARIDSALTEVSDLRSTFGAIQNRFESTISNLTTTTENLQASRSRILDADFAQETANLTRVQILQQAGISVLSQANVQPQNVLALLQ